MISSVQIADFDIQLTELLLVHKNTFIHRFKWTEYRTGRAVDGFTFCVSGKAYFDFGKFGFELNAGEMVFLPYSSSYVVRCESQEPFIHYTVNFKLERDKNENGTTAFSEIISGNLRHITSSESANLYSARLEELLSVWQSKKNGYKVKSKAIIYDILYFYFTDAGRVHRNRGEYNMLLPAKKLLDEKYYLSTTTAELAELCSMSVTNFRRMFTKLFAMPPMEYKLNKRLLRAKDLLLSGQYSISEAAKEVGFDDPNYFTRVFKANEGVSPSEFIKGG